MIETIGMDTTVKAKEMIDLHINLDQGMIQGAMTQGKDMTMVTQVEKENEMIILIQVIMDQGNNSTGESRFMAPNSNENHVYVIDFYLLSTMIWSGMR